MHITKNNFRLKSMKAMMAISYQLGKCRCQHYTAWCLSYSSWALDSGHFFFVPVATQCTEYTLLCVCWCTLRHCPWPSTQSTTTSYRPGANMWQRGLFFTILRICEYLCFIFAFCNLLILLSAIPMAYAMWVIRAQSSAEPCAMFAVVVKRFYIRRKFLYLLRARVSQMYKELE